MGKENLYKTITETVPEFFIIYNLLQKKITFVSPQFFEIVDKDQRNPHQDSLRSYIHPEDQENFDCFFDDLSVENNYAGRTELRTLQNLGKIRWLEINSFPVESGGPQVEQVVGHIVDITEKKERISILEDEQEKLDSVLKILAHDMRAPFTQVHMISDILRNMMTEREKKKYGMYISMLQQIGNRSLTLLDSLLRLVALQEGTLNLELRKHDLRQVVREVAESFKVNMLEKQINCSLELAGFAVVCEADVILLEQAISNLISNAVKFTPDQGQIFLRVAQDGEMARIEVEDNGIGIPEKHIPDLFKEFSKIRRKGLKGEKSTGLGLAITKQIFKLHKGQIKVKSKESKGTRFIVSIPLA